MIVRCYVYIPADVVDTVWMKCTKPNHERKSSEHQRTTVCEARSQQQTERKDDERRNNENVPQTVDTSQLLDERATCGLACVVRQHRYYINISTSKHQSPLPFQFKWLFSTLTLMNWLPAIFPPTVLEEKLITDTCILHAISLSDCHPHLPTALSGTSMTKRCSVIITLLG